MKYDFCGWATRNDVKCTDGRTIKRDAFKDCDGKRVPLVWNHQHDDNRDVLGWALLENRPEGVYAYCSCNDTENGQYAKEQVCHGDIGSFSIYANQLKQGSKGEVYHGIIRELSLVLAGANPEAYIEQLDVEHSEDGEFEANLYLCHTKFGIDGEVDDYNEDSDDKADKEPEEPKKTKTSGKKKKEDPMEKEETLQHAEQGAAEKTVLDVYDAFDEEQKVACDALVAAAYEQGLQDAQNNTEDNNMKHNAFENDTAENSLQHAADELMASFPDMVDEAKRNGTTLRNVFMAHAADYGIENIEMLFPDAKELYKVPRELDRRLEWVSKVMNGVSRHPFSRIRMTFADLTTEDIRAKGYIKTHEKIDDVFGLLRRSTEPQTVYNRTKLDRDDVIDITSFDVMAWLKQIQRKKLDEELARAFLIGDGRNASSEFKIKEDKIRPIWTDDDLFTIKYDLNLSSSLTDDQKAKAFIRACVKSRKLYRGAGNPTLFTAEDTLADMLLCEDGIGHRLYPTIDVLKNAIRVSDIVTIPEFENKYRTTSDGKTHNLKGIIVNLADYAVGADKGGEVNFFDDFDIDFNQMKYLIETRCSGALTVPYSAIVIETTDDVTFSLAPTAGTTTRYGKSVSDLQSDLIIHDNFIQGELKYVTGYTGYSGEAAEQEGNYMAFDVTGTEGATLSIEYAGRTATISDGYVVLRVRPGQKTFKVSATASGKTVSTTYSLKALDLEPKA